MKHSVFNLHKPNTPVIVASALCAIAATLMVGYIWSRFALPKDSIWQARLDLNGEGNFGAAFSAFLLVSCAPILWKIASLKKGGRFRNHWRMLSVIFAYLAADEWFQIHERVGWAMERQIETEGIFYYAWVIPGSLIVLTVVFLYRRFVNHLPTQTRRLFYLSGGLYIFGILGMEMLTGYFITRYGTGIKGAISGLHGIEESTEMLGSILFVYTLLSYLQTLILQSSKKVQVAAITNLKS